MEEIIHIEKVSWKIR